MEPVKFSIKLDEEKYFEGLARQPMDFHQALGELIDNALSARRPKEHGDGLESILVEIAIEEKENHCIVQVADHGIGITEREIKEKVFNPGGQGEELGAMNEHGFGLKNALALLTGGNRTNFSLITRNDSAKPGSFLKVEGPLGTAMELYRNVGKEEWETDLHHLENAKTGTKFRVDVNRRYLNSIYRKASNFETLMNRLGEHLGVMYRHYLSDGNEIRLAYRPLSGEWIHQKVPPILIPYEGGQITTSKITVPAGGAQYEVVYDRGILDYTVKDNEAFQEKGWPYPLKVYYQGSNARCGIDITVRKRVILTGQFESIWPDISKTVAFNRFIGELRVDESFRTTNNKTGLDPHSENWETLVDMIQEIQLRPEEITRSHSEKSLSDDLVRILEGTFTGSQVRTNRSVWGGGTEVDIVVRLLDESDVVRIYELKVTAARILDVYQLVMGWDGLVEEGINPTVGILVAKEISETVRSVIESFNKREDVAGNQYKKRSKNHR